VAGLIVLNAALLYCARVAIRSNQPTALSKAIGFLHREYEPHIFYWELVEMLRRLVLVGVMVLYQDTMMQLVIGTLLAGAFLLFQVQASPYINMSDDLLASSLSFCMVVCFLCCYAFKDAELTGLAAIQDKMSIEQKNLYVLDQGTLTAIMMCSIIAALVISAAIFAVQFAAEAARAKRDAHANRARRLRYVRNGQEAEVPSIEPGQFHLLCAAKVQPLNSMPAEFIDWCLNLVCGSLSHVWGSGQVHTGLPR
jgi:hypothetical protein